MYPTDGPPVEFGFCLGPSRVAAMGPEYDSRDEMRVRGGPKPSSAIALHET